jgi:hypothetical protein
MDPVTLMLVAGATQAVGAIAQGNAQAAQYDAQAQAARFNADQQRRQAEAVGQQTAAREDIQRRQARQVFGRQIAAGAQSGVNITTGSASDMFRSSLMDAEMDALNIRYDGEMNRIGLLNQANVSDWEGSVAKVNSKTAQRAGYLNAAVALTGAAAGAYGAKGATAGGGTGVSLAKAPTATGARMGTGTTGLRVGSGTTGLRY